MMANDDVMGVPTALAVMLIVAEPGKEYDVMKSLSALDEVIEAHMLFGEYDIFAKLTCSDFGRLSTIVVTRIRNIEGIESTKTLTVAPTL
jgi:DNA-binding Lrp family transcriptional regulator